MDRVVPNKAKLILLLLVSLVVATGSVLFILLHHEDGDNRVTFTLQDVNGNAVTEASFKGKWSILVFGFTHCPDVCPSQVFTIAESLNLIDSSNSVANVQAVFISVDYLRDTATDLDNYLTYFHPNFVGFLGSRLQLDLAADAFGASYSVTQVSNGSGEIEVIHSSTIYLINPDGLIVKQLPYETNAKDLANTLSGLI